MGSSRNGSAGAKAAPLGNAADRYAQIGMNLPTGSQQQNTGGLGSAGTVGENAVGGGPFAGSGIGDTFVGQPRNNMQSGANGIYQTLSALQQPGFSPQMAQPTQAMPMMQPQQQGNQPNIDFLRMINRNNIIPWNRRGGY